MEETLRSGGVVKKKSSSGCLIIKKKGEVLGSGVGSSHKEKKRRRLIGSDRGSSDESLEHVRRKANDKIHNGLVVYGRRGEGDRELRRNGEIMESERKRSRLDLFDFDEYDEFDGKRMRNDYAEMGSGSSREFGGGSGRNMMVEKRSKMYFDRSGGGGSGRNKVVDYGGDGRFVLDEDEANLPISLLRFKRAEKPTEPIRLQGKNGVLKVMVNKKKNMELPSRKSYDHQEGESRKGSRSEDSPPFHSDSRRAEKRIALGESEKSQLKLQKPLLGKSNKAGDHGGEKSDLKMQKLMLGKSSKAGSYESDGTDTSLKLAPPSSEAGSSKKVVKGESKRSLTAENVTQVKGRDRKFSSPSENVTPVKGLEAKLKRGGSTEKQLLRERIREMLVKAGWTIDYRPRRNRDYLDAVYINPGGTAYWSIIKAYDAFQKQLQEENDGDKPGPLSDDLINKLTRQTRKKIEEKMKRKRRDDGLMKNSKKTAVKESTEDSDSDHNDERLCSFIRQNGKPKKGRLHEVTFESRDNLSDDSCRRKHGQERAEKSSTINSSVVQGRKSGKFGRCALLVRSSDRGQNSEYDGYIPYTGKRTLLAWLIDSGTVQLSEKVQYMNRRRTQVKLEGWITRDGIHCGCCSKILTVSKFELHAGSKLRQPFQNIMLESGPSLLQCLVDAWNRQEESVRRDFYVVDVDGDDPDDDTCGICGDGGDLICCDGCPSTFHQNCLGIQVLPPGDWHCPNCTCKFCGTTSGSPNENIVTSSKLSMCTLCEKKYHKSCCEAMVTPLANANNPVSFCGKMCQELYDHLQKIIGVKHELEAGFSWTLIQRTNLESDTSSRGFPQRVEGNSKLAVALSVMDECFLPTVDRRSGINLIHNVLYNCGSNFSRLNYRGFFTVVLEKGDEIISTASIRIHGHQLAEMPFIGTRNIYRRQGMCRRLLSAIESVLCTLKVEKLIIPAISEHMHTWTVVFGFKELQDSDKKEMKSMNMLVFPGIDMLQKLLAKQEIPNGMKSFDSKDNLLWSPASVEEPDNESSPKQEGDIAYSVGSEQTNMVIEKADALAVSSASTVPSNDGTVASALETGHESDIQLSSKMSTCFESQLVKDIGESPGRLKCSSTSNAAADPPQIESSSELDPSAKSDVPSSADNLASAQREKAQVSPSVSIVDFPGKTSEDMVEDADENQNPVSVATDCDTDDSSIQKHMEQQTAVVEIQRKLPSPESTSGAEVVPYEGDLASSADGSVTEAIVETVTVENIPISLREISSQNINRKASSKENLASDSLCCIVGVPTVQFNSDLNQPVAINAESGSQVSTDTLIDAKAAIDLKIDPNDPNQGISALSEDNNNARNEVKAGHCENAPDLMAVVPSQHVCEEIRKREYPSSDYACQHTDTEAAAFVVSLSHQNTSEKENGLSVASESDSGLEVSPTNREVHSSSEFENVCEVNAKGIRGEPHFDSDKISRHLAVEQIHGALDGTNESSVHFSPELNQKANLVVETRIRKEPETSCGEVSGAENVDQTDGENKLDYSVKLETVLQGAGPDLGSCASLVGNTKDNSENELMPRCSPNEGNPSS